MKVILIYPDTEPVSVIPSGFINIEPLGLEHLAGELYNHDVTILDLKVEKNWQKALRKHNPDVVGITGTAFTNHTIEYLLGLCHPNAYVVILGGTAPISPVLFDYGVDAVSGTLVTDPETVMRCVSQGATFRQIRGTRLLTMTRERD